MARNPVHEPASVENVSGDLRDVGSLVKIAWHEASAHPDASQEIFDRLTRDVRRIAGGVEAHLRDVADRSTREDVAVDKAMARAERRALDALAGVVATSVGDEFDPHGFFVYCLWGVDAVTPLYVGQSSNLLARLGAHMTDRVKRYRTTRITLIRCETEIEMDRTEARLIQRFQPPLNAVGIRRDPVDGEDDRL